MADFSASPIQRTGTPLKGLFHRSKTSNVIHKRDDLAALQFLAESRHAASPASDNGDEITRTRKIGMRAPPVSIREVWRLVQLTRRRLTSAVEAMAPRTVVTKQFAGTIGVANFRHAPLGYNRSDYRQLD